MLRQFHICQVTYSDLFCAVAKQGSNRIAVRGCLHVKPKLEPNWNNTKTRIKFCFKQLLAVLAVAASVRRTISHAGLGTVYF